ncbi:MAG TPA: NADH-quinone oxidoreductase subunit K [Bacteriovoracaceae bacterium]|nr:NADH-quinone oxidoreductase subunit K [Bacteriovoracaceae bacterium]
MDFVMPILVGLLFSAGLFFMLRPHLMRIGLGIILLTNATNLFLFSVGRITKAGPPIIPVTQEAIDQEYANPLSQALILTAIVIGFAVLSFVIALVYKSVKEFGSEEISAIGLSKEEKMRE